MIGIYKITNKLNGKIYVGQSNNIERRFQEHCSPSRYLSSNIPVDFAIHKYGKENFTLDVLEECSLPLLNERETYWIKQLDAIKKGYNCNEGGQLAVQGEQNPNAKLTREDVVEIRKEYAKKEKSQREVFNKYKDKITWNSFRSLWQGTSWTDVMPEVFTEENKEYYKKAANKRNYVFSDECVAQLRNLYVTHTAKELYEPYSSLVEYSSFQSMLCGRSYHHLPYYHKKTKTWINPGEQPKKHPNRVKQKQKIATNIYSDEEVMNFRKMYQDKDFKQVYELSDKKLEICSFQKMLTGRTYKHLPVYSKTRKEWVYK